MTYHQERLIPHITQPLKNCFVVLSAAIGTIRRNSHFQSPKHICGAIASAICATEMLRTYDRIGLLLDGSEVSEKFLKALTTFDFPSMADWATTNFLVLAVVAILLWMVRPMLEPPTRWLVTAIGKYQRQARSRMTARKVQRRADLSMVSEQPQTELPKQAVPPRQTNPRYLYGEEVGGQSRFRLDPPPKREGRTSSSAPQPELSPGAKQTHFPGFPHPGASWRACYGPCDRLPKGFSNRHQ